MDKGWQGRRHRDRTAETATGNSLTHPGAASTASKNPRYCLSRPQLYAILNSSGCQKTNSVITTAGIVERFIGNGLLLHQYKTIL